MPHTVGKLELSALILDTQNNTKFEPFLQGRHFYVILSNFIFQIWSFELLFRPHHETFMDFCFLKHLTLICMESHAKN